MILCCVDTHCLNLTDVILSASSENSVESRMSENHFFSLFDDILFFVQQSSELNGVLPNCKDNKKMLIKKDNSDLFY